MARFFRSALALALLICAASCSQPSESLDKAEFLTPPASAGLDTWWHWGGTNISREGIRKDLEAMHRNGIKRATILNVSGTPGVVPAVKFASDEWFEMFRYSLQVADSLGMKIGIHNCAGWSTSGGTWITPEKSIKMYVWTGTDVNGGQKIDTMLPEPQKMNNYYEDAAVLAFPCERKSNSFIDADPEIICPRGEPKERLYDSNPKTYAKMAPGSELFIKFDEPYFTDRVVLHNFREFAWLPLSERRYNLVLSCSDDGVNYRKVSDIAYKGANITHTIQIPATTARYFKFKENGEGLSMSELELLREGESASYNPPVRNYLNRFYNCIAYDAEDWVPDYDPEAKVVCSNDVIDLTANMSGDGHLVWDAPEGEWKIVRFGFTTSGVVNAPADGEATGLESDKMDAGATEYHFNSFVKKCAEAAGDYTGNVFSFVLVDSWECRYPNWTANFMDEFLARRGYDIKKWIPAMCGQIVDGPEQTEQFIEDYEETVGDLILEKYYKKLAELCHKVGLEFHCEPIYGNLGGIYPGVDILKANSYCDLPMTEFWAYDAGDKHPQYFYTNNKPTSNLSCFPVDVAILSGKKVIGAEAYTSYAWFSDDPQLLKPYGDDTYCSGVNQFILHSYVHQPLDYPSHMTLVNRFASHFNRNNPWFTMCRSWFDYQMRVQYILQKGETVTDILYYVGDSQPECVPVEMVNNRIPVGYRHNAVNFQYLDKAREIGMLVIPDGVKVNERTEKKLRQLEKKGVTVLYDQPGEMIPMQTEPDITLDGGSADPFMYIHKKIGKTDAYFVFNHTDQPVEGMLSFRINGRKPQIWNPENGEIYAPEQFCTENDRVAVNVSFKGYQSLFFIFDEKSDAAAEPKFIAQNELPINDVRIDFEPFYDEQIPSVTVEGLQPLNTFKDAGIRYFGGKATYTFTFDAPADTEGKSLKLNLGALSVTADIWLNGEYIGNVWHDDFDIAIPALKEKGNEMKVVVGTNLRNRTIGDMLAYGHLTHVLNGPDEGLICNKEEDLMPSGLLGPVSIKSYQNTTE